MPNPIVLISFDPWSRPYLREITLGIRRYADEQTDWRLIPTTLTRMPGPHEALADQARGMITDLLSNTEQQVRAVTIPRVLVGPRGLTLDLPWVGPDYVKAGRMACQYLLERGYRSLACFRNANPQRVDARRMEQGMREAAAARGLEVPVLDVGPRTRERGAWDYEDQIADLVDLLRGLPKPLGLFGSDDPHAWRAVQACELAGIEVPREVAVLGFGNDAFTCEFARPTLSSISVEFRQVGYAAGRLLDQVMAGREVRQRSYEGRMEVITRQSTGHVAVADPDVAKALAYIEEHFASEISVEEVADAVLLSRRTLLRRFKALLDRSPGEEIRRRRIEEALRLIRSTDVPLLEVAVRSGFGQQSAMGRAIKAATGRTPGQLRDEAKL